MNRRALFGMLAAVPVAAVAAMIPEGGPARKVYVTGEGPTAEPIWGGPYNIDARGASADLVERLPEILREHGEGIKRDVIDGIRRNRYPL